MIGSDFADQRLSNLLNRFWREMVQGRGGGFMRIVGFCAPPPHPPPPSVVMVMISQWILQGNQRCFTGKQNQEPTEEQPNCSYFIHGNYFFFISRGESSIERQQR